MSFDTVLIVLGASFVSAWAFIGGMLMQDTVRQARRLRFDASEEEPPSRLSSALSTDGYSRR